MQYEICCDTCKHKLIVGKFTNCKLDNNYSCFNRGACKYDGIKRHDNAYSLWEPKVEKSKYSYYDKFYKGIKLDPYRIFKVYDIRDPAIQHTIKKLLRLGGSIKDSRQDIDEAIDSLKRYKEMILEDM